MLQRNLFFLYSVTLLAVVSTIINVFNYNPYEATPGELANFYISFFVAFGGIMANIIYFLKLKFLKDKTIYHYFFPSVRQGLFISLAATIILFLKPLHVLDWWVGLPLVIAVGLLELFFQTVSPSKKAKS